MTTAMATQQKHANTMLHKLRKELKSRLPYVLVTVEVRNKTIRGHSVPCYVVRWSKAGRVSDEIYMAVEDIDHDDALRQTLIDGVVDDYDNGR